MHRIIQNRVIAVASVDSRDEALYLAEALLKGGLNVIEITFRTAAAEEAISAIHEKFPEMLIGAGTILTIDQVRRAFDAGAHFGVSPGLNESVVQFANHLNWEFIPGVMTPTEVEAALNLECTLLKFFPAEAAGGVKTLKALSGPYSHTGVKFIPLGGINASNAAEYLKLPIVAAVGGTWLADRTLIKAGDWDKITQLTQEILQIAKSVQTTSS